MIYHYTTIETLALILKSKRIRFNNLTDVDDMLEGDLFETNNLAQHIFVSCWTKDQEENIALWKLYNNGNGVRIGLPDYPWQKNYIDFNEWEDKGFNIYSNSEIDYHCPFKFDDIFSEKHIICPPYFFPYPNDFFTKEVIYLSDHDLKEKYKGLYQRTTDEASGKFTTSIFPKDFGRFKHRRWEFQKELRFVLFIFPLNQKLDFKNNTDTLANIIDDYLTNEKESPVKDFFLNLDESSLNEMEIMLGPLSTKADEIIVAALIHKYDISTKLTRSKSAIRK